MDQRSRVKTTMLILSGFVVFFVALWLGDHLKRPPCSTTPRVYYWMFWVCASLMTPPMLAVASEAGDRYLFAVTFYMCENIFVACWIGTRWGMSCYHEPTATFMRSASVCLVNCGRVCACFLMQYRVEVMGADTRTLHALRVMLVLISANMVLLCIPTIWVWTISIQAILYPIYLVLVLQYFYRLMRIARRARHLARGSRHIAEAELVVRSVFLDGLAFSCCMAIATVANLFWLLRTRHSSPDSIDRYINVCLTFLDIGTNQYMGLTLSSALTGALGASRRARFVRARRRQSWRAASKEFVPELDTRWHEKVLELAGRGFTLEKLLDFYESLGHDYMEWFDPNKSTTCDVVRAVIIPETRKDKCAMATKMMGGIYTRPGKMVTHNWANKFADLVAAIVADALQEDDFKRIKLQLTTDPRVLRRWVKRRSALKRTYWVCALSVNQHCSICGANPGDCVDTVTSRPYEICNCDCQKYMNHTAPLLEDGRGIACELNKFDEMMRYLSATDPTFEQVVAVDAHFVLFTRAWCIAEIAAASKVGMKQHLKIWSAERLDAHSGELRMMKIENMQATRPEDKVEILSKIPDRQAFDARLQALLFQELFPAWEDLNRLQIAEWIGRFVRWEQECQLQFAMQTSQAQTVGQPQPILIPSNSMVSSPMSSLEVSP